MGVVGNTNHHPRPTQKYMVKSIPRDVTNVGYLYTGICGLWD